MATQNLGRVGLVLKGEWDSTTAYTALDVVSHDGNAWAAKQNSTNVEPTTGNSDFWQLFSNNADLVATVQGLKESAESSAAAAAASAQQAEEESELGANAMQGIAPVFAPTAAYSVGEYVWYRGVLYRFTANHAAGSWTGTDAAAAVIGNDLTDLKSALVNGSGASTGNTAIVFCSSAYYPTNAVGTESSSPTASSSWAYAKVPCQKGDIFTVNLYGLSGATRAYAILDTNNIVLYRTTRVSNFTTGQITIDNDDAAYVVFNNRMEENPNPFVIKGVPLVDRVATAETAIQGKQDTLTFDELPKYAGNNPVISKGVYKATQDTLNAVEKINGLTLITDYVYNRAYNTSGDSVVIGTPDVASSFRCALIACQEGDKFTVAGLGSSSYRPWVFVDANGEILDKSTKNGSGLVGLVAPSNSAYFIFNTTITYGGFCAKGLVASIVNYYAGKKINWIGDSIVAGADFDEMVCQDMNLIETDYGIGGSTISLRGNGTDTRDAICVRYANMTDDADIIAISAGTNDFEYAWAPIGTIESTENTTFYGALKNLCEGLITKYPQKIIFFTTPIKRAQPFEDGNGGTYTPDGVTLTPFSKNKYGLTLKDYADIIKEVCGYYSIPVLDLYSESMLNPHIAEQQNLFDVLLTHPTHYGRLMMARRVKGWLLQLAY